MSFPQYQRPVPTSCCGGDHCGICLNFIDFDFDEYVEVLYRTDRGDWSVKEHLTCRLGGQGYEERQALPIEFWPEVVDLGEDVKQRLVVTGQGLVPVWRTHNNNKPKGGPK